MHNIKCHSHFGHIIYRQLVCFFFNWYCRRHRQQHKALKMFKEYNRDTHTHTPRLKKQRDSQMFVLLYTSHWQNVLTKKKERKKKKNHRATKPKELTSCFSSDSSAHLEKCKKTVWVWTCASNCTDPKCMIIFLKQLSHFILKTHTLQRYLSNPWACVRKCVCVY